MFGGKKKKSVLLCAHSLSADELSSLALAVVECAFVMLLSNSVRACSVAHNVLRLCSCACLRESARERSVARSHPSGV